MPDWRERFLDWFLAPRFRPWALATPILVLLFALPLSRPIASPNQTTPSERLLLASVQSLASGRGLALDPARFAGQPGTVEHEGRIYADRPPMLAVMLAGPAVVLQRCGLDFDRDEPLMTFALTVLGVTLPVAFGAGFVYRMARVFDLSRPRRVALSILCVFATGWVSYATVLNPHAPAAACVMLAVSALLSVGSARRIGRSLWVLILAGQLAALAATIDPWTLPLVLPLPLVVLGFDTTRIRKTLGIVLMTLGAAPVVWSHSAWSISAFDSIIPPAAGFVGATRTMADLWTITLGSHGILVHFPLLVAGVIGGVMIVRGHWPTHVRILATLVLAWLAVALAFSVLVIDANRGQMFALRWGVTFSPMVLFLGGVLLRRNLSTVRRLSLATLAVVSIAASVIGAKLPLPAGRFQNITVVDAAGVWLETNAPIAEIRPDLARGW